MNTILSKDTLTKAEFHKLHFQSHRPVIHKGGIKNTEYFNFLSFNYLKSKLGSRKVKIAYSKKGYYKFNDNEVFEIREMQLSNAIEHFVSEENSKNYYLIQTSINKVFPELIDDLELPPNLLETDVISDQNIWAGGSGCVSPLHFDKSPNFLVQVQGSKSLTLFSPNDSSYLYPIQNKAHNHLSEINLENIDHQRFPLFKKAQPYTCILEPGDILYIPVGWWHEVRSLDASISINYWFQRFDIYEGLEFVSVADICNSIQFFLNNGVKINSKDPEGEILLIKAIKAGLTNVVEAFLLKGADPNSISCIYNKGVPAVLFARKLGKHKIIQLLLKHGATDLPN